jgi:acetyl-CoA C-acetyltransferase
MMDKKPERIILAGAVRTPMGSFGGGLKEVPAARLLAICWEETLKRTGLPKEKIDEVIAGNVCQPSDAINIARVAALLAGIPNTTPAFTVQRNCASGVQAITSALQAARCHDGEVFLVGGTENMSQVPYLVKGARWGYKLKHYYFTDGLWEGLTDPIVDRIMGRTAENLVKKYNISREEQDAFAVSSHQKAFRATRQGKFKEQIVPVAIQKITKVGTKELVNEKIVAEDENINPGLDKQTAALQPGIFMDPDILKPEGTAVAYKNGKVILETRVSNQGTVTPKNSCPISDGAASMLLMTESTALRLRIKPEAYIVSYAYAACDPDYMGEGPIYATRKALDRAGLTIKDMDAVEINEAFAGQIIPCQRVLEVPEEKLNVWGGAIALGHPVGATGAILTVKLINILKQTDGRFGLVTMCVGGGQGGALIIEGA